MPEDSFVTVASLSNTLSCEVDTRGLIIRLPEQVGSLEEAIEVIRSASDSPFGKQFAGVLDFLYENDICSVAPGALVIPQAKVLRLYDSELGLTSYLPDYAPFTLYVKAINSLGYSSCRFKTEFFSCRMKISALRLGAFVARGTSLYVLPENQLSILMLVDRFNSETDEFRSDFASSLRLLGEMKKFQGANVKFDAYLSGQDVVVATNIGVELKYESTGKMSVLPCIAATQNDNFWRSFKQAGSVQDIYDVADTSEHKLWVIPEPGVIEALKVLRGLQHLSDSEKHKIICDPMRPFMGKVDLDLIDFSHVSRSVRETQRHVERVRWDSDANGKSDEVCLVLECVGGSEAKIPVSQLRKSKLHISREGAVARLRNPLTNEELVILNDERLQILESEVEAATTWQSKADKECREEDVLHCEESEIEGELEQPTEGSEIAPYASVESGDSVSSEHLVSSQSEFAPLAPIVNLQNPNGNDGDVAYSSTRSASDLVIVAESSFNVGQKHGAVDLGNSTAKVNEPALITAVTHSALDDDALDFLAPRSLTASIKGKRVSLKRYQKQGIAWLQYSYALSRRNLCPKRAGSLLADDMGLGKTLQVLTFIASCLEDSSFAGHAEKHGTYRPILLVAPLILLNVWESEIKKFFRNSGQIFSPFEVLYGQVLQEYKSRANKEHASLDTERLVRQKVIITNYDTMKNHIDALERVQWSIVVADEAQEIKEPDTAKSKCIKLLKADFRVALTGTPVENRLSDLWSIFDFAQPGILGSMGEFKKKYEANLDKATDGQRMERANDLRRRLCFNENNAYVIRRRKQDNLDGLPSKVEHLIYSELSPVQIQLHKDILSYARSEPGAALGAVQKLMYLYQHSALITDDKVIGSAEQYLLNSPKLRSVVSILDSVSRKREKVLLFTRSLLMQQILKLVIREHFGIESHIINGVRGGGGHSTNSRQALIDDFEKRDGFNALILSPEVAGVGLTIIGANNVIHYGRWWNPAVESQATDRCYRLGQTKTVNVYYPIGVSDEIKSFDERLQKMLWQKKALAADFLVPTENLSVNQKDLFDELIEEYSSGGAPTVVEPAFLTDCKPEDLEDLYSCILRKQGFESYLAKRRQGIPLFIARRGKIVKVIICRSNDQRNIRDDADDARYTVEQLQNQLGESSNRLLWEVTIVANHLISQSQFKELKDKCELIDQSALQQALRASKVSVVELLKERDCRIGDSEEILRHLVV